MSFLGLTLILTIIFTALSKKYISEPHTIDIYEGFFVSIDSTTQQSQVYYITKPTGYISYYLSSWNLTNDKINIFKPTPENSLPVKFRNVKYKIINGISQQFSINKPVDTLPPYLQEERYYTKRALFIESAIQIKYQDDTVVVEKAARQPNAFTLLSERIFLITDKGKWSGDSIYYFQGKLITINYGDGCTVNKDDLKGLMNNKNILLVLKTNGDTIETYNKITFNNFPGQRLTSNWFIGRINMENIRNKRFDNYLTFLSKSK
jgi:hypothetical protein